MPVNPEILNGAQQIISKVNQLLLSKTPVFVSIAGGSCSGKTTLTNELVRQIQSVSVLNMDDYFLDLDDPNLPTENGRISFDCPQSYHMDEMVSALVKLNQHQSVSSPVYNLDQNHRTSKEKLIPASEVVIVDGLYAIKLANDLDLNQLRVFVQAPYRTRLLRRIRRDHRFASDEVIEQHFHCFVEPMFLKYVLPQSNEADIIIQNE